MEKLLEFYDTTAGSVIFSAVDILTAVFLMLAMYFAAKRRNKKLSVGWYICAFLFPIITAIIFLVKKRKFPKINDKVCPICSNRYPEFYQLCSTCLIELDDIDYNKKKKERVLSIIFGVFFAVFCAFSTVTSYAILNDELGNWFSDDYYSFRIAVTDENGNEVYYDKMGNVYENAYDVPAYSEDGEVYILGAITDETGFTDYFYVNSSSGEELWYGCCYVNQDGWFSCSEEEEYVYDYEYSTTIETDDYIYYANRFLDEKGNIYYYADEASWNAEGELITAENDPNIEK